MILKIMERQKKRDAKKPKPGKPKTILEKWKNTALHNKVIGVCTVIAALAGVIYTATNIVSIYLSERHYAQEHRPKVIFSRPPALVPISGLSPPRPGRVYCQITNKAVHLSIASLRFWIGNTGGDAKDVFTMAIAKLVTEQPTDNPEFDESSLVTDDTCKGRGKPMVKEMPLGSRRQTFLDIRQVSGIFTLFRMKSGSITFDQQGSDPTPPPDIKPSDWTHIAPDAKLQIYIVACVDYSDKAESAYASCATYRFIVNGHENTLDPYGFSCQETPLAGAFQPTFGGYCEK